MKTRRFIVYSLIYIALVGVLIYSIDASEHTFSLLDYSFTLPLAVWFVIPIAVFALLCIFHIAYHGFEIYMFKRAIKRDESLYKELAKEIFLGLDTNKDFKTELYKNPSQVARILSPYKRYKDVAISDDEIESVVKIVNEVQGGEVVDLKKFKLPKDNPLHIKNELNKLDKVANYFNETLKNYQELNDEISKKAYDKMISFGSFADIKKFSFEKSSEDAMTLINRFVKDEINLTSDDIFELLDNHKITKCQYSLSAVLLKDKISPDALINIFEKLKATHQDAEEAYIYVLFELQMIDQARDILNNSEPSEYQNFKALLFLRDHGKIVPTDMFIK